MTCPCHVEIVLSAIDEVVKKAEDGAAVATSIKKRDQKKLKAGDSVEK